MINAPGRTCFRAAHDEGRSDESGYLIDQWRGRWNKWDILVARWCRQPNCNCWVFCFMCLFFIAYWCHPCISCKAIGEIHFRSAVLLSETYCLLQLLFVLDRPFSQVWYLLTTGNIQGNLLRVDILYTGSAIIVCIWKGSSSWIN